MRNRIWVLSAILFIIFASVLLFYSSTKQTLNTPSIGAQTNEASMAATSSAEAQTQAQSTSAQRHSSQLSSAVPPPRSGLAISNTIYQQMHEDWHKPIEFYGKVVDESSNVVAGHPISVG